MKTKIVGSILLAVSVGMLYQNCSQSPFGAAGFGSQSVTLSSVSAEPSSLTTPFALLSSEQVFKSMSSVTGVQPNGTITNEYNNRQSVLGTGFDLKLATSPMMIGITNLASTFCLEALNKDIALPADQRKFFASVDFAKPIADLSDTAFASSVQKMSNSFWGRGPSSEEVQIFQSSRTEFASALTDAEKAQNATSKNLMLFTCTAMLSSFDSISF
jgi:hypothetical protein